MLVVVVAAAVGIGVTNPFGKSAPSRSGASDNAYSTSLWTVARRDLSSQTSENATLGYAGSYTVVNQAVGTSSSSSASSSSADSSGGESSGTFTSLPGGGPSGKPGSGALPGQWRTGGALTARPRRIALCRRG